MTSRYSKQRLKLSSWTINRPHTATLILLGAISLFTVIMAGWFSGEQTIREFFAHIYLQQQNPPFWIQVPELSQKYLFLPTILLVSVVLTVFKMSPRPKLWSRALVVAIVLALMIRYMLWRSLSSLNLSDPFSGTLSLGLILFEALIWVSSFIRFWLLLKIKDRSQQANQMEINVREGEFTPTVDILIPTYQEPVFILKRTIIGCQALEYSHKKVYLLDDNQRPEIQKLAQDLGCQYITRPDHLHAKAGNLNHALPLTDGQLIVVFDADFIPTRNFLTRTVGFFQDPKVALVQTPQSFYNPDPIARNLGLEKILPSDEEVFYRHIELFKDGSGSTVCAGTSFVVRRSALEEIGGFVTESISEDYFTGIRLSAQGYQLIYLKEKLSAGLAAENVANYFVQRQRWGRGTLQAFFIKSNPLTIPNLKLSQRLAHLEGLINWLTVWAYPYFLLMPLGYAFFGILPIQATVEEWLYFFLPHFCVQIMVFRWLNEKSRSAIISEIYQATICFPLSLSVFLAMMNPFKQRFKVTEKGISNQSFVFNWALGWPLIVFFVATFIGFFRVAGVLGKITISSEILEINPNLNIGLPWMIYNLFAIGVAIFALVDAPQLELYEKFDLQRIVRFKLKNQVFWGMTTKISEVGAEIQLTHELEHQNKLEQLLIANQPLPIQLDIVDEGLKLTGNIIETAIVDSRPTLQVQFKQVTLSQHRELIKILFCRPGQWKDRQTPGEIRSLFLILKTFFNPPFLRNRNLRRKVSR